MYELIFCDPGHFHAALLLGRSNERIAANISVYGPSGPDLDRFLEMIEAFNARKENPTNWRVSVIDAKPGTVEFPSPKHDAVIVLAGKNAPRLGLMQRLHQAGFSILADKPWLTTSEDLHCLDAVTEQLPLAIDIMTSRHDIGAILRQKIIVDPDLFGGFKDGDGQRPVIEISSLHNLCKIAAGRPLLRPTWYYDVAVQGDGVVDIQSHMVDQAQWLISDEIDLSFDRHIELIDAMRWNTEVPLPAFQESTGVTNFPNSLSSTVHDDVLHLACNSRIDYRLCGHWVRQTAEWQLKGKPQSSDSHFLIARGQNADLVYRLDGSTGFKPDLRLRSTSGNKLLSILQDRAANWQAEFPGLKIKPIGDEFQLDLPSDLDVGHEGHFPLVLDEYLDLLDRGDWPTRRMLRIRSRYTLLAKARDLAISKPR